MPQENDVKNAFTTGQLLGLPLVYGEWALGGGYHYYPEMQQVREWLAQARFRQVAETEGDEYQHFFVQKSQSQPSPEIPDTGRPVNFWWLNR